MDTSNNDYYQPLDDAPSTGLGTGRGKPLDNAPSTGLGTGRGKPTGTQSSQPLDDAPSTRSTSSLDDVPSTILGASRDRSGQAGQVGTGQGKPAGTQGAQPTDPAGAVANQNNASSDDQSEIDTAEPAAAQIPVAEPEIATGKSDAGDVGGDETKTEEPAGGPAGTASDQNPDEVYNNFIERLVQEFGYNDLPETEKAQLIDAIKERVETRILRTLMTSLTKEQSDEMDREVKEKGLNEEAIIKLLAEKAPNASTAILSALDDLYLEMKEENEVIQKAAQRKAQEE